MTERTSPATLGQVGCAAEAHYALEGLPNKVLAEELDKTRRELEARRIARGGFGEGGV